MTATFGKITVTGTVVDIALARRAYGVQLQPVAVGDLEPRAFRVEFHSAAEFIAAGAIIPGSKNAKHPKGVAAWGYTFAKALWINRNRLSREQTYALRHEPFHPIVAANMTAAKRALLLPLAQRVASNNPYQNRLSEVLCDAFVELFWGRGSILDDYYGEISDADLQKAFDTLMKPVVNEPTIPVEPPVPLPLPDPRDAQITDLTAALQSCQAERSAALLKIGAAKAALA